MLKIQEGTQIRFFVTASFSPADAGTNFTQGTPTDVALTLAGLANGAGRQSAKVDLGADRHAVYHLLACVDFTGETPTAGKTVDYYWLPSTSATTGTGNVAGNSGEDAATPWGVVPSGLSVAEFSAMGIHIGTLVLSDDAAVQNGYAGCWCRQRAGVNCLSSTIVGTLLKPMTLKCTMSFAPEWRHPSGRFVDSW